MILVSTRLKPTCFSFIFVIQNQVNAFIVKNQNATRIVQKHPFVGLPANMKISQYLEILTKGVSQSAAQIRSANLR